MNLFTQLSQHARIQPETIAYTSRHRIASYRKLWSRIERATARLQAEWGIKSGDAVAYCGQGHPDALVLYVALLRCGALLVPLEHPSLQKRINEIARVVELKIILHDDHAPIQHIDAAAMIAPISALIMTRCPYQPSCILEDPSHPGLIRIDAAQDAALHSEQKSLLQITAAASACADPARRIAGFLFDAEILGGVVLPALMAGRTLDFA
ncbi:MAG: AMP-binding protein [Pseudomonadota bacterium]